MYGYTPVTDTKASICVVCGKSRIYAEPYCFRSTRLYILYYYKAQATGASIATRFLSLEKTLENIFQKHYIICAKWFYASFITSVILTRRLTYAHDPALIRAKATKHIYDNEALREKSEVLKGIGYSVRVWRKMYAQIFINLNKVSFQIEQENDC